ncbi:hypothetical protein NHX12_027235 [Muraenolepis orangiensis]|uniref:Drebrin-like protein n=1 Tax=Muraenolepis orangiensis TaxID=630683 RepID=A0A9Q0IP15_9TELE|nr:hypothetical protein NHX12_027235 [Muraenolepis orangiensis]
MYAFCCVKDPNSGLPKYVLINWTGEGVKDSRKGAYANHLTSMANFLKGAHVTVNARAEEDVDPEAVLAKVAKASGVNFNFQMKRNPEPSHVSREPVGSVYKKTNAKDEIGNTDKDRFWAQTQREEEDQRKDSSKKVAEEKQRKINAREEIQQTNKDHFWAQTQKEEEDRRKESRKKEEKPTQNRTGQNTGTKIAESVQKANEAKLLISQRFDLPPAASPSPAEYENHEPPVQPTEDDWSDEFEDDDDYDEVENNLYDELPGDDGSEEPLYEDLYEAPPVEDQRRKARALYDYKAEDHTEITFDPHDLITGIEMSSEGWWKGYAPNGHYGLFPANYVKLL